MFKVLSGQTRRVISPATLATSVAAHVLLLGGVVYAAASDTRETPPEVSIVDLEYVQPEPVEPEPEPLAPQSPASPDEPTQEPVAGETLELPEIFEVPGTILPEPPGVEPVDLKDYSGIGPVGDVIGEPPPLPTPLAGDPAPSGGGTEFIPGEDMVEVRPELQRDGLARTLGRYYPAVLRDARVAGTVMIEMVVNEDGRVREGSARVVESSHPAFGEAAVRAVERFRFRPARMGGQPVPVRVTLPINWTVPN